MIWGYHYFWKHPTHFVAPVSWQCATGIRRRPVTSISLFVARVPFHQTSKPCKPYQEMTSWELRFNKTCGCWTKNRGFLPPKSWILNFNRVFHEINHPFSSTPCAFSESESPVWDVWRRAYEQKEFSRKNPTHCGLIVANSKVVDMCNW